MSDIDLEKNKAFLLDYYISVHDIEKAKNLCRDYGKYDSDLWITFLNYLCMSENPNMEEIIINSIMDALKEIEN